MCTLSFSPGRDDYIVAMNRDELLTRGIAEPPAIRSHQGVNIIYPLDVSGGTWIAVNGGGATWALLNWDIGARASKERSRGEVVLQVAGMRTLVDADAGISGTALLGVDPFRLIGISAQDRQVLEWRWSGADIETIKHPWERHHWFSSGKSDELAAEHRGQVFTAAAQDSDVGTLNWLRRIHSSHKPDRGAYSVCVHREDAATVSYTEVQVLPNTVKMSYRAGSPCHPSIPVEFSISRQLKSATAL